MGMETKNCCLVKEPKITTKIKKSSSRRPSPLVRIFKLRKITNEKNKLVKGSGKTPVLAKTNMGIKATSPASVNDNVLLLGKINWPVLKLTTTVIKKKIRDISLTA